MRTKMCQICGPPCSLAFISLMQLQEFFNWMTSKLSYTGRIAYCNDIQSKSISQPVRTEMNN